MLTAHFTFSKTQHGCKLDNLDSTLGVTRCASPPPNTTLPAVYKQELYYDSWIKLLYGRTLLLSNHVPFLHMPTLVITKAN